MNILWHAWEPGLVSDELTSAGGGMWLRRLFKFLRDAGHEVYYVIDGDPSKMGHIYPKNTFPFVYSFDIKGGELLSKIDVAFFAWRWTMPTYPEREAAYKRQLRLIDICHNLKIPTIIHDQDHKVGQASARWLKERGVILAAPELKPKGGYRRLIFPDPYEKRFNPVRNRMPFMTKDHLVYIGNNYERYGQTKQFLKSFSEEYSTKIYGNWMEPHPDRKSPQKVLNDFPDVMFPGRLEQRAIVEKLATANSTIHLSKASYCRTGFVTVRWAEAAAAATPAFIPFAFYLPFPYRNTFDPIIVRHGQEMIEKYEELTQGTKWVDVVLAQQEFVDTFMRCENWLSFFERVKDGDIK